MSSDDKIGVFIIILVVVFVFSGFLIDNYYESVTRSEVTDIQERVQRLESATIRLALETFVCEKCGNLKNGGLLDVK